MIDDLGEDRRLGVRTNLIEVARPMLFTERVYHVVTAHKCSPNLVNDFVPQLKNQSFMLSVWFIVRVDCKLTTECKTLRLE